MRPDEYWKNFNLGTELDIAGRFIFNGLQTFHRMEHFATEEDTFEFLYAVSVGVERLLKIALILTEHGQDVDQDEFEKDLITHSHQKLMERLKSSHTLKLSSVHNEFISILARFYKSHRYGRYSLESVTAAAQERDDLNGFLEKHLNIKIDTQTPFGITKNERRHRQFIGKTISKIVNQLFEIVQKEARRLNLYTYEIEYGSKASKIFHAQTFDFENEDILQMELLAYLVSEKATGPNSKFLRECVDPLSFDPALEADYIAALRNDQKKMAVLDELEALYEDEVSDFATRREMLDAATSHHLHYGMDEDDEIDD
jgi:hypothetical protein